MDHIRLTENRMTRLGRTFFLILTRPLVWLPRRMFLAMGSFLGSLAFFLIRKRRKIAVVNIARAVEAGGLPKDTNPEKIAQQSFAGFGRTAFESLCLLHKGLSSFRDQWQFVGEEHLWAAIAWARENKKGLVLLTGHMGNWEMCCLAVARHFGVSLKIVGRSQGGAVVDSLLIKLRSSEGNDFIFKDGGAKDMLRALRSGGFIGTLYDQAAIVGGEGQPVMFLGRMAMTNLGPLKLAAKTGSKLVPMFCRREGENHFFEITPALDPPSLENESLLKSALSLNTLLGQFVARYPDSWMWGHRRWKTPEGIMRDKRSF